MDKIFIASSNPHKIEEIRNILAKNGLKIEVVCPKDFNDDTDVKEDGQTFLENALIKAKYYFEKYHIPTLADDSGISIDYFNGLPGIHSARFLGKYDVETKNNIILEMMEGIKNRKAHYTCCLVFMDDSGYKHYEGIFEGEISTYQNGSYGFGYDPIFYLPEYKKNCAEVEGLKDSKGHRFQALSKWINDIK